ncbi:MAG: DedA family protein [Vibrio sp.]
MDPYLTLLQENMWLAFIGIVLLSYLLEDLAIITAALLSAQQTLSSELALIAIFIGIASGDALLYGLGIWARRWRGLRYRLLTISLFKEARRRLKSHTIINIFIIRFIPGLRSISFTLSGYFQVPFVPFLIAVLLATAAWTAFVFSVIYTIGTAEWLQQQTWKWLLAPVALLVLWLFNRLSKNSLKKSVNRHALSHHQSVSKG